MAWIGTMSEQQRNVYAAEHSVRDGQTFVTYAAAQAWADSVTASEWWSERYGFVRRIEIQDAPSGEPATGSYDADKLVAVAMIPREMLCERVILHEAAHAIIGPDAGHGPRWTRELLGLFSRILGSERYLELYEAFTQHNVDIGTAATGAGWTLIK